MFPFLRFADCIWTPRCARTWSVQLSREADVEFLIEEVNGGWACNVSGLYLMPLCAKPGLPYDLDRSAGIHPPGKLVSRKEMDVFGAMVAEMVERGILLPSANIPILRDV